MTVVVRLVMRFVAVQPPAPASQAEYIVSYYPGCSMVVDSITLGAPQPRPRIRWVLIYLD
ncbi:Uncharacterised protein [Porphyromonas cangingivalis]|nr:Uncharacterised protein [Porphyromonas cangingivalis]